MEIKSSSIVAQDAIAPFVDFGTSTIEDKQIHFAYVAGIVGMENARLVSNQLLQAIGNFTEATLSQANKFPIIAQTIEKVDMEEAKRWKE